MLLLIILVFLCSIFFIFYNSLSFSNSNSLTFKTRLQVLMRDADPLSDFFETTSPRILAQRITDGGLTPITDTNLLLTTYRDGSHLTSDINIYHISILKKCHNTTCTVAFIIILFHFYLLIDPICFIS